MSPEAELREKLKKIEALFSGAKTDGERAAAGAALERIKGRLTDAGASEAPIEMRFTLSDPWGRKMFLALCRRYGLKPYRYPRMHKQTVMVRAPRSFIDGVLWPEYLEVERVLRAFLGDITERVIAEEIDGETGEAEIVGEVAGPGAQS
jgi:hypothetical protein